MSHFTDKWHPDRTLPPQKLESVGLTPENANRLEINRFYEELMAHIILSGGRRFEMHELEVMPLGKLARLLWPNGLRISIYKNE